MDPEGPFRVQTSLSEEEDSPFPLHPLCLLKAATQPRITPPPSVVISFFFSHFLEDLWHKNKACVCDGKHAGRRGVKLLQPVVFQWTENLCFFCQFFVTKGILTQRHTHPPTYLCIFTLLAGCLRRKYCRLKTDRSQD